MQRYYNFMEPTHTDAGEPWLSRFHPEELPSLLRRLGFSTVTIFSPEQACERYLKGRFDGLTGRRGEQLARAIL
jgi:O-methyltransferase involved in polyketide biosynthesis